MWHFAQYTRLGEEEGRAEKLEWRCTSFQVAVMCDGPQLSWKLLNICLPMGSDEWIPCFALLTFVAFALSIKLSLSQSIRFLHLLFWLSPPSHCWGSEWGAVWHLVQAGLKPLTHGLTKLHLIPEDGICKGFSCCWHFYTEEDSERF